MRLLKTFINTKHQYLECEYENSYPTYWLSSMELDNWSTSMPKDLRTYVPIGYIHI